MVQKSMQSVKALAEAGIEAEMIDVRTLVPLDSSTIFDFARKTRKIVEEN